MLNISLDISWRLYNFQSYSILWNLCIGIILHLTFISSDFQVETRLYCSMLYLIYEIVTLLWIFTKWACDMQLTNSSRLNERFISHTIIWTKTKKFYSSNYYNWAQVWDRDISHLQKFVRNKSYLCIDIYEMIRVLLFFD